MSEAQIAAAGRLEEELQLGKPDALLYVWRAAQQGYDSTDLQESARQLFLAERRETLRRAWSRLDDGSRDLLAGKYILEKSDDEIAEELGCASGSVRMKLTRARRRLLETMKEEEADHGKT